MKTCPNCQKTVEDNEMFCPNCGTKVDSQPQQEQPQTDPVYTAPQQQDYTQQNYSQQNVYNTQQGYVPPQPVNWGLNTTPFTVWSILNLLFCCLPLGIWSLVLATGANKKPTLEEAQKSLKTAKILCIVSTVAGALIMLFSVVLPLVMGAGLAFMDM